MMNAENRRLPPAAIFNSRLSTLNSRLSTPLMSESPFHSAPSTTGGPSQDDVIEFRCSSCGSLLRVPGGAVGRKVKCPRCETINEIAAQPSGADAPASDGNPSAAPASTTGAQSPSPSFRGPSSAPPVTARPSPNLAEPMYPGPTAIPTGPSAREPGRSEQELAPTSEQMLPVKTLFDRIIQEVSKIYVGQDELVLGTLVALFSSGHVLIESVPGLGKTLFVRTLGKILGCRFGRIQFTADLMPSDITGAPVYNMKTQEFDFRPGLFPLGNVRKVASQRLPREVGTISISLGLLGTYAIKIDIDPLSGLAIIPTRLASSASLEAPKKPNDCERLEEWRALVPNLVLETWEALA